MTQGGKGIPKPVLKKESAQDKGTDRAEEDMLVERILVIDDDIHIGNVLEKALSAEGYSVQRAYSGTEAVMLLRSVRPDLILLDLMLPGLSGEEILPMIKGIPVIIVSAKVDVDSKVNTLLGGAADYMTKPFEIKELLARIQVQLRNRENDTAGRLCFEDIYMNADSPAVFVNNKEIQLTRTEHAILKILLQNQGRVITKSTLLDRISRDTPDCTERSLKQHVSNLRGKLSRIGGKEYIETVWGIGFKIG